MITLRIVNWPDDTGLDHISTSWQISDKTDFNIIMDEVVESTDFLNVFRTNIVIPIGKEFYGRSKRHFSNGSSTEWIGPIKIISNISGDNIDIKPEVYIEEPTVNLIDDIITNTLIIKSGSFRCKDDGHKATSWILKDGLGNVLYRSMYDVINKKELIIDKNLIGNNNTNVYIAEVCHVSTNDYESHFGSYRLELNKFNFEVISNTNFISVNEDYEFKFRIINGISILTRYEVLNDIGVKIQEGSFVTGIDRIIIDREKLKPNTTYRINIYSDSLPDDVNVTTFYTNTNESIFKVDKKYKYEDKYYITSINIEDFKTCMVEQFIDDGILLSHGINKELNIFHFNKRNESLTVSDLASNFITNSINGNEVVVKVIDNTFILIDSKNVDGIPTFTIFDYTYGKLIKTIVRTDEVSNSFNTNNITVGLNNKVYYFANVNDITIFRCLDINTGIIIDLNNRPDLTTFEANLVYVGNDRIMSLGGSGVKHLVYLYDISDDVWYDVSIVPERYRNLPLTSFLRKDGKVISFNTSNDTNDVLVFNPKDNSIEIVINDLDDTIDLNSTIRLRDGEFLRYDSRQINPTIYRYR